MATMHTGPSKSTNRAGLQPADTKDLMERQPQQHEQPILLSIREMYSCKPTKTTFDIYSKDAVFHDPIGIARGIDSIRNQFTSLAKLFEKADIPKLRVLENPTTVKPNTLLIDQDVAYYRDAKSSSPTKTVNSLLTLELDPTTHKVLSHTEEWDHKKTATGEDGFFGWMNEQRKKMTADVVDIVEGNLKN